ncbi:MAG: histidine phosphatase family protein [Dehalobacter sp.]|nr:histidine phosphatase family protein [Dehalobacter sp.]MDJ0306641.1 histidine phosphatase family protein [Dehalobacter sp.]
MGQTDIPLSDLGIKQAELLKRNFGNMSLDNIYCSDLERAQQTATIIASAHQIVPTAIVELREMNMGAWEGKLFSEIRAQYPQEFKKRGENIAHITVLQREKAFLTVIIERFQYFAKDSK